MTRKPSLALGLLFLALATTPTACTKVVAHSKDRPTEPITQTYPHILNHTFAAARTALEKQGYTLLKSDEGQGSLETGWVPTKATSHYVDLFGRRDYGTISAYYQLQLKVTESEGKSQIVIAAPARSLVHRIRSSQREEKRILREIGHLLRREDFELTNVGASE